MSFDLYYCEEKGLNEIKKFPELKFNMRSNGASFSFNFDDLFIKIGNQYHFLVIFENYQRTYWEVGYPLFKKYDIVFDEESKTISYYNRNKTKEYSKDKDKNKILKIVFIVFLGVIVLGGLVGIGFYYGKITYMQRKKRANELKDGDFD